VIHHNISDVLRCPVKALPMA